MSTTRIYAVRDSDLDQVVLVRAPNVSQAIRAVVQPRFTATVATQDELVRLIAGGEPVIDWDHEPADEAA